MNMVFKVARATRNVGSFGLNVIFPAFGIPRPWNYFAGAFWIYWMCAITYGIVTR